MPLAINGVFGNLRVAGAAAATFCAVLALPSTGAVLGVAKSQAA